jgi:hypothetical protein
MNRKGSVQIIAALLIVGLLTLGIVTYFHLSWKTYHNEQFGIEFKYPRDWYPESSVSKSKFADESSEFAYLRVNLEPDNDTDQGFENSGRGGGFYVYSQPLRYFLMTDPLGVGKIGTSTQSYLSDYREDSNASTSDYQTTMFQERQTYVIKAKENCCGYDIVVDAGGVVHIIGLPAEATNEPPNFGLVGIKKDILSSFKLIEK